MNRFSDAFGGIKWIVILAAALGAIYASPLTAALLWLLAAGMQAVEKLPVRDEDDYLS